MVEGQAQAAAVTESTSNLPGLGHAPWPTYCGLGLELEPLLHPAVQELRLAHAAVPKEDKFKQVVCGGGERGRGRTSPALVPCVQGAAAWPAGPCPRQPHMDWAPRPVSRVGPHVVQRPLLAVVVRRACGHPGWARHQSCRKGLHSSPQSEGGECRGRRKPEAGVLYGVLQGVQGTGAALYLFGN